jgi:transposase
MPKKRSRVFSRAFKLAAVRRMIAGEDVSALSRELRVLRKDLYWRTRFGAGGPEALRCKGSTEEDRGRAAAAV